jgi:hypothetical protein
MSKKNRQLNYKPDTKIATQKTPPKRLPKWLVWSGKLSAAVSIFLTIVVSFLSLSINIVVTPGQQLDINDPMTTPFIITNDSILPIHSVDIRCGINGEYAPEKHLANHRLSIFRSKEQETFFIPQVLHFKPPLDISDLTVDISYRPDCVFWRNHRKIRFMAAKDKNGVMHWYQRPSSAN